jgi:2-polyprenyl-3-methyl-5-hydroxy-6-metoxy-1,4-benzoquinol methylase
MTVKESNIRPEDTEKKYNELLTSEISDYFLDNNGRIKGDISVDVNCLACDENDSKLFMEKDGFALQHCNHCGLVYLNPRPTESVLIDFFSNSKAIDLYSDMVESTKVERYDLIFNPLADFIINKYGDDGGSLLEVGCGSGLFLETMATKADSWSLKGVEPSQGAVDICNKKNIDVFHGGLESLNDSDAYDVIVFWAVFDHFFDPFTIVEKTHKLLKKGGSIVIGNLNIEGFESSILGKDNAALTPPERQNFFGIESMSKMLTRAGFKDVEIKTTGKLDVDIVKNYWSTDGSNERSEFLEKIIFGSEELKNAFQSFLMDNNLSGHMTVTAIKGD